MWARSVTSDLKIIKEHLYRQKTRFSDVLAAILDFMGRYHEEMGAYKHVL